MKNSNFLSLNWLDLGKGLVMAILTPAVVIIQQSIEAGTFTFEWNVISLAGIGGGFAYLVKNFFSKPIDVQSIILPKPPRP